VSVPVDWDHPRGPRIDVAVARRPAADPAARVGTLVFSLGIGSGVDAVMDGGYFDAELSRRFDLVGVDARGVGRSHPVVCSRDVLLDHPAVVVPSSRSEFTRTVAFSQRLRADCRARTAWVPQLRDYLVGGSVA
jgi:hypothetical protein